MSEIKKVQQAGKGEGTTSTKQEPSPELSSLFTDNPEAMRVIEMWQNMMSNMPLKPCEVGPEDFKWKKKTQSKKKK